MSKAACLLCGLHVITERWGRRGHLAVARAAAAGGAGVVQLRDKQAGRDQLLAWAGPIREITRRAGILFIVNDDPELARLTEADGVHVGPGDRLPAACRAALGPERLIGVSAGTVEEALQAEAEGADYLGVGPIFATSTKPDAGPAAGPGLIRRIKASVSCPVVAIGGINHHNLPSVLEAGADGAAVISAVSRAAEMEQMVRRLVAMIREKRSPVTPGLPKDSR